MDSIQKTITITKDDWEQGVRGNKTFCAGALALNRAFPGMICAVGNLGGFLALHRLPDFERMNHAERIVVLVGELPNLETRVKKIMDVTYIQGVLPPDVLAAIKEYDSGAVKTDDLTFTISAEIINETLKEEEPSVQ